MKERLSGVPRVRRGITWSTWNALWQINRVRAVWRRRPEKRLRLCLCRCGAEIQRKVTNSFNQIKHENTSFSHLTISSPRISARKKTTSDMNIWHFSIHFLRFSFAHTNTGADWLCRDKWGEGHIGIMTAFSRWCIISFTLGRIGKRWRKKEEGRKSGCTCSIAICCCCFCAAFCYCSHI